MTRRDIADRIAERCLRGAADRVGIEAEWFVTEAAPRPREGPPPQSRVAAACDSGGPLPAGGRLSWEPGGQVEISTSPATTLAGAIASLEIDEDALRARLGRAGYRIEAAGVNRRHAPVRVIDSARYRAMEQYFASHGDDAAAAGRRMMCGTAALQVNAGSSSTTETARRWRAAHRVGPALAAAFASSPTQGGASGSCASARLENWWAVDPTRTAPVPTSAGTGKWVDYCLAARVMLIRAGEDDFLPVAGGMTLGAWADDGHALGFPDGGDVDYHLTTLFPPVRLRGWIEMRFLDAVPAPWWQAAVALTYGLVAVDGAAEELGTPPGGDVDGVGRWRTASRHGLADPAVAADALRCCEVGLSALAGLDVSGAHLDAWGELVDRSVRRGLSPAAADDAGSFARVGAGPAAGHAVGSTGQGLQSGGT